jgi:hypothetical protein
LALKSLNSYCRGRCLCGGDGMMYKY